MVLNSASRVMSDVTSREHRALAGRFKETLAAYRQAEDMINIGAYKAGSNPKIDYAIAKMEQMIAYLKQDVTDGVNVEQSIEELARIFEDGGGY